MAANGGQRLSVTTPRSRRALDKTPPTAVDAYTGLPGAMSQSRWASFSTFGTFGSLCAIDGRRVVGPRRVQRGVEGSSRAVEGCRGLSWAVGDTVNGSVWIPKGY